MFVLHSPASSADGSSQPQNWSQIAVIRLFIETSWTIARQDLFYEFNHHLTKLKGNHSYSTSLEYDSSFTCKNTWANLCCTFYGFESWNIFITKFYHFCSYAAGTQGGGRFYHAINCYSFTYMNSNKCKIYPVIKIYINYRSYLPLFGIDWQRADNPQWEIPICQSENETTCPLISEFVLCTEDALEYIIYQSTW